MSTKMSMFITILFIFGFLVIVGMTGLAGAYTNDALALDLIIVGISGVFLCLLFFARSELAIRYPRITIRRVLFIAGCITTLLALIGLLGGGAVVIVFCDILFMGIGIIFLIAIGIRSIVELS